MKTIRMLLVDDHALVRAGIYHLLRRLEGIEVVAEAGDSREAMDLIRNRHPDVALIDIARPELAGLKLMARVRAECPATRVLVLAQHESEDYALRAVQAGVCGYLLASTGLAELEAAIRAVARGETYLSPAVSRCITAALRHGGPVSRYDRLAPRQREVLDLITEGHPTKAIAKRLGISLKTAEAHRTKLMEQLDLHCVAEVVRYGYAIRARTLSRGPLSMEG